MLAFAAILELFQPTNLSQPVLPFNACNGAVLELFSSHKARNEGKQEIEEVSAGKQQTEEEPVCSIGCCVFYGDISAECAGDEDVILNGDDDDDDSKTEEGEAVENEEHKKNNNLDSRDEIATGESSKKEVSADTRQQQQQEEEDMGQRQPASHQKAIAEATATATAAPAIAPDPSNAPPPPPAPVAEPASSINRKYKRLPDPSLVGKHGYVLALTSFRTTAFQRWRHMYWIQYGLHTVAWFRSEADFQEWLYNPHLDSKKRSELIKLAVNFAQDLFKPHVNGYNATQRTKRRYGNHEIHQFKLERFMDDGPPVEALFGAYHEWEVDNLREALIKCMRNTPLTDDMCPIGAVKQVYNDYEHNSTSDEGATTTDGGSYTTSTFFTDGKLELGSHQPVSQSVPL